MSLGWDRIFLLYSQIVYETADVISTYVYKRGLIDHDYSMSTAIGLFNSVINLTLLLLVNTICRRLGQTSLW